MKPKWRACAIDSEHRAPYWGDNADAQLGQNSVMLSPTPIEVTGVNGWRLLAAGERYMCGVSLEEAQICSGGSSGLQMVVEAPPRTRTTVAIGVGFACGLRSVGQAHFWGVNNLGQVGDGKAWLTEFTRVKFPNEQE